MRRLFWVLGAWGMLACNGSGSGEGGAAGSGGQATGGSAGGVATGGSAGAGTGGTSTGGTAGGTAGTGAMGGSSGMPGTGGGAGSGGSAGSGAMGGSAGMAGAPGGAGGQAGMGGAGGQGGAMASCTPGDPTADYVVTFDATWSMTTHPTDFPSNPHFSGLIGTTHDDSYVMWEPGGISTPGMEEMAELGRKTPLDTEIAAATGTDVFLSGMGIGTSPDSVTLAFTANAGAHYVSLVSMLAPSPDWFVGVHGLSLCENDAWASEVTATLYVYDSGTDDGTTYIAPNVETVPFAPIARHEGVPFLVGGYVEPVGTFTFTRQ